MLEKIGLPPKPSLRGNNWVVDASHCQGCSSQFTFLNRKHHCRRCGGLFCNSCTNQRMALRGQGDSPVRICDPCKKLEEAARFEMRYGHKNRSGRGTSKVSSKNEEEEVLNQILSDVGKGFSSSARSSSMDTIDNGSSSNSGEVGPGVRIQKSASLGQQHPPDAGNSTPEELRQQAIEEKKKYKTLKAEGKSEEALRAFKRGKELERLAAAQELYLRKNRKKALAPEKTISTQKNEGKDDLASELKELGWSDMDLRDAEKRPATTSVESELSTLLGEVSQKSSTAKITRGPDKSQVIAHKKKALELKRAGNLVEAKEELKKAKLLEKQIEEQEFLGESDESDDELSLLMRSIDNVKDDAFSVELNPNSAFDFDLLGASDNFNMDGNVDVTEDDLDDPEIAAALSSLGWAEETRPEDKRAGTTVETMSLKKPKLLETDKMEVKSKISIQKELIALKKNAFALKRAGKMDEAEEELNRGKILEKQLEELDKAPKTSQLEVEKTLVTDVSMAGPEDEDVTDLDMQDPAYLSVLQNLGWKDDENHKLPPTSGASRRSKGAIQSELLGLKRKAFALRRQGKVEEAEEVLKDASVLEEQLAEIETPRQNETSAILPPDMKVDEHTASSLKMTNLPKDSFSEIRSGENSKAVSEVEKSFGVAVSSTPESMSLQQEILAHKRKALKLKREGKLAEAKEELAQAKLLEKNVEEKTSSDVPDTRVVSLERKENSSDMGEKPSSKENSPNMGQKPLTSRERFKLQQQSLGHKRQALKLRREGRTEEADAELELAKALEAQLEESTGENSTTSSAVDDVSVESFLDPDLLSALKAIGIQDAGSGSQGPQVESHVSKESSVGKSDSSDEDGIHLQERIKAEKVKAVQLKRSGKQAEAMDALRRAKLYEKKLNDLAS